VKFGVIIALLLGALAFTNPTQEDYAAWAKFQLVKQGGLQGLVGGLLPGSAITEATQRTNLLLFSIFDTNIGDAYHQRTLGVFSHFITLKSADRQS